MEETNEDYTLSAAKAFKSLTQISTSYNDGLGRAILDMIDSEKELYMSDILDRFGQYTSVQKQIKRLVLDNQLILYETQPNSIANNKFNEQKVKLVDQSLSQWQDMAAQPCLTCAYVSECAISNPVSSATCEEFNAWLSEELEIEFDLL